MTKFKDLTRTPSSKNPTKFNHYIDTDGQDFNDAVAGPTDFDVVEYLGTDSVGNDIFRALDSNGAIYFYMGRKGDEFNQE